MVTQALVVRARRVVSPVLQGGIGPASVVVRAGRIVEVAAYDALAEPGAQVVDAGNLVVMPGLVDTHVHVNEPGRTAWEGFASATRAAAAGGVTTLVDMPLNSIPATTSAAGLAAKIESTHGKLSVDVGFCGGVVPGNRDEIVQLRRAGVLGFKCFLTESGVDEFRSVREFDLRDAMKVLADIDAPLLVHAELDEPLLEARTALTVRDDPRSYATYLRSRPKRAENEAVAFLVRLARELRSPVHVVHLSSAEALASILAAREQRVRISAETCPHYLHFAAEDIADGATEFKCAPPIREAHNRELLWAALGDGSIDQLVSDHSPCTSELKRIEDGDFMRAWGGISSLQLGLAVVWNEASRRGHTLAQVARWMCAAPAQLAGLAGRKGSIEQGHDADFVVFDPDARFTVAAAALAHRNKLTPYAGRELLGVVRETWLRGEKIYERGRWLGDTRGRILRCT
jgi:allantoinase